MKVKENLTDLFKDIISEQENDIDIEDIFFYQFRKVKRLYQYIKHNTSLVRLVEIGDRYITISVDFYSDAEKLNFLHRISEQQYNDDINIVVTDKESMTIVITTNEKEVLLVEN